jgi:hypothetical protein
MKIRYKPTIMKKYNLQLWLPLMILVVIFFASCSKKTYPESNTTDSEDKYENTKTGTGNDYVPPPVIVIADEKAKSNKDGELYYDNELGYRYWRSCDGNYYLDAKYESGAGPSKKVAKKNRKENKKQPKEKEGDDIATQ